MLQLCPHYWVFSSLHHHGILRLSSDAASITTIVSFIFSLVVFALPPLSLLILSLLLPSLFCLSLSCAGSSPLALDPLSLLSRSLLPSLLSLSSCLRSSASLSSRSSLLLARVVLFPLFLRCLRSDLHAAICLTLSRFCSQSFLSPSFFAIRASFSFFFRSLLTFSRDQSPCFPFLPFLWLPSLAAALQFGVQHVSLLMLPCTLFTSAFLFFRGCLSASNHLRSRAAASFGSLLFSLRCCALALRCASASSRRRSSSRRFMRRWRRSSSRLRLFSASLL